MQDDEKLIRAKTARGESEDSTRTKIFDAACTEFAERGLDGARVDHIAKRAGVNKAMIYYHFRSKELLYETIIKTFFEQAAQQLKIRTSEGKTPADFLLGAAETHVQLNRATPEFRQILLRELANPREEVIGWIVQAIKGSGVSQRIREQFEAAIASGQFRAVDVRQAILSFITMSLGYLLLAPVMDRIFEIEDHDKFAEGRKAVIVDLFLNGVMAR